jgi:hypothetical protein
MVIHLFIHLLGRDCCTFCFESQFRVGSEYYQQASEERKRRMEKFAEGSAGTNFEFNPSDITRERIGKHPSNAVSSRRYHVADGPGFWKFWRPSTPAAVLPAQQPTPGTSPDPDSGSLPPSGGELIQFGRRVFGGPGEAGTV